MEAGFIILASIIAGIAAVIGLRIGRAEANKSETQGTIYAYYHDSDNDPSLLLEYNVPISDIATRKQVLFNVVVINKNSHE